MLKNIMHISEILLTDLQPYIKNNQIQIDMEVDKHLNLLQDYYPFEATRIDWARLYGVVEITAFLATYYEDCAAFFKFVSGLRNLAGKAVVVNDGAYDFSLLMDFKVLDECFIRLIEEPHNTFIMAEDFSWCMAFTMEGQFNFGYLKLPGSIEKGIPRAYSKN